ncbi:hypothetical protein PoB_005204700 [Plakobranchus ocellatus]|uniref:Uncharacterized protein n=1 Tax=Plakobranchus ocellatus TaxID=259542 RepID=A0AAV4C1R0_9GAST|nr:hypothetical protein PoB_005204700 [Plakobranchus ocellatus]
MASENPKTCAAVFDLQQVIYTPKSHHSSIFYKRRLANYSFTIFDLQSQEGRCFLWHEGIARRGANEISTCIYKFLQEKDSDGTEKVLNHQNLWSISKIKSCSIQICLIHISNFLKLPK